MSFQDSNFNIEIRNKIFVRRNYLPPGYIPCPFCSIGRKIAVEMPAIIDHCIGKSTDMTTVSNSIDMLEVFDKYKHNEEKDSDEESFHLPLDDDDAETKSQGSVKNSNDIDEEAIMNKFATDDEKELDSVEKTVEQNMEIEDAAILENDEPKEMAIDETAGTEGKSVPEDEPKEDESSVEKTEKLFAETRPNGTDNEHCEKYDENLVEQKCEESKEPEESKTEQPQKSSEDDPEHIPGESEKNSEETNKQTEENKTKSEECEKQPQAEIKNFEIPIVPLNEEKSTKTSQKEFAETSEEKSTELAEEKSPEEVEKLREKNENSDDAEDLFDISIIRDADQDNAESALNEAVHCEENEELEDNVTDKTEDVRRNIEYEEDVDGDNDNKSDDVQSLHNEDVDIEDSNLKEDVNVNKDSDEDCEKMDCNQIVSLDEKKVQDATSEKSETKETVISEFSVKGDELKDISDSTYDITSVTKELVDDKKEVHTITSERRKHLKRSSETEIEPGLVKRTRLNTSKSETKEDIEIVSSPGKPKEKLRSMLSLAEFMKSKKISSKRLTVNQLEEFCIQKLCEVLLNRSDLGDINNQLKKQEQIIDSMRKEIQQLTKQARDLEVVNKRLMNDLKNQNTTHKPLNPLKITRSVGLQVKFTPTTGESAKKRIVTQQQVQKLSSKVVRSMTTTTNSITPPRQVMAAVSKSGAVKSPSTILSHALQTRRTTEILKNPPPAIKNAKGTTEKVTSASSSVSSVIDLTDEDDKKNTSTKVVAGKNITVPLRTTPIRLNTQGQSIRLTTTQGGKVPISQVVTSTSTPQLMYVVQSSPQTVLNSGIGPKTVLVNFQSPNGVIKSALNGSAMSVIQNKQLQLKPITPKPAPPLTKIVKVNNNNNNKHPAPLPTPPIVRVNTEKSLKPIPPKPHLTIRKTDTGIILQWRMPYELDMYEVIASYQLYAYQETNQTPSTDMWRKVGDVKALALPMACTLTQFADKNTYYFAVRPVDIHKRIGLFSEPEEISL